MLKEIRHKSFANGCVYALQTEDGYPIETTSTFLPYYTKDAIGRKQNTLVSCDLGDRSERWMIGASVQSGCPVRCKFCATGQLKRWRNLTWEEMVQQIDFVLDKDKFDPSQSKEFKINWTRMGENWLNIDEVRRAIDWVSLAYPNVHHYISTIGVKGSDFSWIEGNTTLQISLHSLDPQKRDWLIPYKNKMSIEELGQIRTRSNLKTTINLTLVDENDFDIEELKKYFDPKYFFIKLSPINVCKTSIANGLGNGVIIGKNLL